MCVHYEILSTFLFENVYNKMLGGGGDLDQVNMILTGTWRSELAPGASHGALSRQQYSSQWICSTFIHFLGAKSQGSSEGTQRKELNLPQRRK